MSVTFLLYSLFFFSSRRRHTRWPRDWSSDVCSSDLGVATVATVGTFDGIHRGHQAVLREVVRRTEQAGRRTGRSEERRVGKSVDLGGGRSDKEKKSNNERRVLADQ